MRVFHLLGNLLFTAGLDPVIRSFNLETGEVKQYEGHTSWVLCLQTYVTYDENEKQKTNWLLSGSDDSTIRIWDITSTKCLEKLTEHKNGILSMVFVKNGLISSSYDHSLNNFDMKVIEKRINEIQLMEAEDLASRKRETFDRIMEAKYGRKRGKGKGKGKGKKGKK